MGRDGGRDFSDTYSAVSPRQKGRILASHAGPIPPQPAADERHLSPSPSRVIGRGRYSASASLPGHAREDSRAPRRPAGGSGAGGR